MPKNVAFLEISPIPEKYCRFDSTDLTADVKTGQTNVCSFDLKL